MGKGNNGMGSKKNSRNKPFQGEKGETFMDRLNKQREEEAEKQALLDEKVQELKEKYEKSIKDFDAECSQKRERLEEEYRQKEQTLADQKKDLDERELSVQEREELVESAEKDIEQMAQSAKEEAIAEVKKNEREIREKEREQLFEQWERKAKQENEKLTKELEDRKQRLDAELEKAHQERVQAESEKIAKIHAADSDIQQKYAELTKEYNEQREELQKKITEFNKQQLELKEDQEELAGLKTHLIELKAKYDQCSELEVMKLQQKIQHFEDSIAARDEEYSDMSKRLAKYEAKSVGDDGDSAFQKIEDLERKLSDAENRLDKYASYPSESRLAELVRCEEELKLYKDKYDEAKVSEEKTKADMGRLALANRELQNKKIEADALMTLNDQLQEKLRFITEQYKTNRESKFQGLREIDAQVKFEPSKRRQFTGSLENLVQYIRNYGVKNRGDNPLYYSKETIMAFIASLATAEPASRLLILQGLSGTGKTSLPILFQEALDLKIDIISVQPSWRDNRELLGYDNDFTNRFKETEFTKAIYRASLIENRDKIHLIVLDEMNLARIEYYFADFLSILEYKDNSLWQIPLVSNYIEHNEDLNPKALSYANGTASLVVTPNIWFIGTANNDDSTSMITDKVYDRAQILDMDSREKEFAVAERVEKFSMSRSELQALFGKAVGNQDLRLNKSDLDKIEKIDTELKKMGITFGNRMQNQLETFVPVYRACGGTKEDAIDYFLAHKILRKLENRYDKYLVTRFDDFSMSLLDNFPNGSFKISSEKLNSIKDKNSLGDEE